MTFDEWWNTYETPGGEDYVAARAAWEAGGKAALSALGGSRTVPEARDAIIEECAAEAERVSLDEETGKVAAYSADKIRAGMMGARVAAEAIRALKRKPPPQGDR